MTRWLKSHWVVLTVAVVALSIGAAIGGTAQPEAKTVTKTRTVHATQTVTETKEVTPESCVETINGLVKASQMTSGAAAKAITAAVNLDSATINAQTLIVKRANRMITGLVAEYSDCMGKAG